MEAQETLFSEGTSLIGPPPQVTPPIEKSRRIGIVERVPALTLLPHGVASGEGTKGLDMRALKVCLAGTPESPVLQALPHLWVQVMTGVTGTDSSPVGIRLGETAAVSRTAETLLTHQVTHAEVTHLKPNGTEVIEK